MKNSHCGKCRFFKLREDELEEGLCLRFPPQPIAGATPKQLRRASFWSTPTVVFSYRSCGEFQPVPDSEPRKGVNDV